MIHQLCPFRLLSSFFKLAASLLLLIALSTLTITAQQRAIVNSSMEDPAFPDNSNRFYAEGIFPGWLTSHPIRVNGCNVGTADCRPFERWSTGFNGVVAATGAGSRWVELNAYANSMIYQNVCLTNGESFNYSFLHRGRGNPTTRPDDVAQFRIGIPSGLPAGSKPANSYDFPIV